MRKDRSKHTLTVDVELRPSVTFELVDAGAQLR
jgi:hypothetical protein